jgi:hypothetical protein
MSGVGKSNLMGRFIHDRFSETEAATVGVDFSSKLLEAADGTKVRAQVWDTGESRAWASCTVCSDFAPRVLLAISPCTTPATGGVLERKRLLCFDVMFLWKWEGAAEEGNASAAYHALHCHCRH